MGPGSDRHFFKEDKQMTNKHMKSCSTSSAMMEMQIKTEENNQVTPTGMAIKKKKDSNNKMWRNWNHHRLLVRM